MVLLRTTAGDIDIELWSKEAPKACRNFIQLCMEEYYNNTIFHRVVPGFIVQGGDPTGTGSGGESIYGAPFKDEFHSRLRFNRRGLVAMANAGPHDNGSQFFFTLGRADELNNKHTIFGKVCYMDKNPSLTEAAMLPINNLTYFLVYALKNTHLANCVLSTLLLI
uniref:Peptidyl-prolyl cis-trans isomerase n=3 Tax=Neognathae TaxID=8825 RepID=U3INZ7_ANAPP